jgi:hypothetical protein
MQNRKERIWKLLEYLSTLVNSLSLRGTCPGLRSAMLYAVSQTRQIDPSLKSVDNSNSDITTDITVIHYCLNKCEDVKLTDLP